jgi:hypothetical protein
MKKTYIVCLVVAVSGCGGVVEESPEASDAGPSCTVAAFAGCPKGVAAYCKAGGLPGALWHLVATDETSETTWCQ